jgi:hypothetical protein
MSPFLSDILFTLGVGALFAPVAGMFVYDREIKTTNSIRVKNSVLAGAAVLFVPTLMYLASYLFFAILNG